MIYIHCCTVVYATITSVLSPKCCALALLAYYYTILIAGKVHCLCALLVREATTLYTVCE